MGQRSYFGIESWAAWSPSLKTTGDWLSWVENPFPLVGSEKPKIEGIQPINRRRLKQLGGMALETVLNLPQREAPIIFCSQHGESTRCYELLSELTETGQLSPQSFSLAVHNSIPSLYTIDRKLNSNVIAMSSNAGIFSALTEAIGLFADGKKRVRIIVAEEPLPEIYWPYCEFYYEAFAYAIDLIPAKDFFLSFSAAKEAKTNEANISINLSVLKYFISGMLSYQTTIDNTSWRLERV